MTGFFTIGGEYRSTLGKMCLKMEPFVCEQSSQISMWRIRRDILMQLTLRRDVFKATLELIVYENWLQKVFAMQGYIDHLWIWHNIDFIVSNCSWSNVNLFVHYSIRQCPHWSCLHNGTFLLTSANEWLLTVFYSILLQCIWCVK